jgi:hypothetical protein
MYTSTWQKHKRKLSWQERGYMGTPNVKNRGGGVGVGGEPANTSCFTHLDEQTASVDETLMEALFTVARGKQRSRQKKSDRI